MIINQITGIIIVVCSLITVVCWFLIAVFGGEKRKLNKEINRRIKERRDEWDWAESKGYKKTKVKTLVDVINESMKKTGGCCPGGTCDEKPKKEEKQCV